MRFGGLIAAIIVAALAAIIVLRMSSSPPAPVVAGVQPQAKVGVTSIYVAAKTIPVGSVITKEMIITQPWPQNLALTGFIRAEAETAGIIGMVARAPFQQNEPIIASKLAGADDPNFLAGDLPAGMRLVTIPLNEVDGVAGFVFPGDHVDLIYTHDTWRDYGVDLQDAEKKYYSTDKEKTTVSETLLTNVKVLAVDQRSSNVGTTDKNGNLLIPRSASLMVSQIDSQRVRLAQKTGTLSLALRSLVDRESADPLILTETRDISQVKTGAVAEQSSVRILRGAPKTLSDAIAYATGLARGVSANSGIQAPAINPAPVAP